MKDKVLYFPYINVPNSIWFTRMLLYWDEVGAIVPYDFIESPEKLDKYTRSLVKECLVRQVIPGQHISEIPSFRKSFLKYLSTLKSRTMKKRRKSFKEHHHFKIHIEKMDGLEYEFKKMGLAENANYPWYFVECDTAREFMSYLAATLGKLERLQFDPVSDEIEHLEHFLYSSGSEKSPQKKLSDLRLEILEDILPSPSKPLNAVEISNFKERHGDKLKSFRLKVEREIIDIANVSDEVLRKRRLEIFKEESQDSIKGIINAMKNSGFKGLNLSKLGAIVASIPGVSSLVGLASAVHDAFKKDDFQTIDPCFLYAAYAQKELLTP